MATVQVSFYDNAHTIRVKDEIVSSVRRVSLVLINIARYDSSSFTFSVSTKSEGFMLDLLINNNVFFNSLVVVSINKFIKSMSLSLLVNISKVLHTKTQQNVEDKFLMYAKDTAMFMYANVGKFIPPCIEKGCAEFYKNNSKVFKVKSEELRNIVGDVCMPIQECLVASRRITDINEQVYNSTFWDWSARVDNFLVAYSEPIRIGIYENRSTHTHRILNHRYTKKG